MDDKAKMCKELKSAIGDESSAQNEYASLRNAAASAGEPEIAEGVRMISKQEKSHEEAFKAWHDLMC